MYTGRDLAAAGVKLVEGGVGGHGGGNFVKPTIAIPTRVSTLR